MSSNLNLREELTPIQQLEIIQDEIGDLTPLLAVYPEEELLRLIKNKDKLKQLSEIMNRGMMNISATVIVMKCDSTECPYKMSCPLLKAGLAPDGYACPIEKKMINELELALTDALDIDTADTVEMELLYDFIDAKVLDLRTSGMLANTSLVQEITKEGRGGATMSKDVAPEFTIKMDLKTLKSKLLNEFMATRLSKKRYGVNTSNSMEDIIKNAMDGIV